MDPFTTKPALKLISRIEETKKRHELDAEYGRQHRRAKPSKRAPIREAKERIKRARYQTSEGKEGETNFMSLPGELRNEIYRLALIEPETVRIRLRHPVRPHHFLGETSRGNAKPWREPGLLKVNKAIRIEASTMYYGMNDFSVCIYPDDIAEVASWLLSIISRCGNDPFRHFHFFVVTLKFQWADLHSMLPLTQLFARTDLKLDPGYWSRPLPPQKRYHPRVWTVPSEPIKVPLFVMSARYEHGPDAAIQEAVDFGKHAFQEKWREDWLVVKFEEWFDEKIESHLTHHRTRFHYDDDDITDGDWKRGRKRKRTMSDGGY